MLSTMFTYFLAYLPAALRLLPAFLLPFPVYFLPFSPSCLPSSLYFPPSSLPPSPSFLPSSLATFSCFLPFLIPCPTSFLPLCLPLLPILLPLLPALFLLWFTQLLFLLSSSNVNLRVITVNQTFTCAAMPACTSPWYNVLRSWLGSKYQVFYVHIIFHIFVFSCMFCLWPTAAS